MADALGSGSEAAASNRSNGSAFTAACERADYGSDARPAADFLSRVFAARASLLFVLIGLDVIKIPGCRDPIQLQYQQGLSRKLACALHAHNMAFNVVTSWNRHGAINCEW